MQHSSMNPSRRPPRLRSAATLTRAGIAATTAVLAAAGLGRAAVSSAADLGRGPVAVDDAVALAVLVVAAAAAAVLALGTLALTAGTTAAVLGRTWRAADALARRLTPGLVRRVVAAGLGVGLGFGAAVSAQADEGDLLWVVTEGSSVAVSAVETAEAAEAAETAEPSGTTATATARVGTAAPGPAPAAATAESSDAGAAHAVVPGGTPLVDPGATHIGGPGGSRVVVAGDSLWSIAAAHLGADATDADVARAWPAWHAANRDVVGADPHHIEPGQVLVAPEGADR